MKRLLIGLLLAALAVVSPASAQNTLFAGNPGDMIYRGTLGWQRVPGGTAGQLLQSNGPTAAPTWSNGFNGYTSFGFVLPAIATNRLLGNVTGSNAAPVAITASQILDTIGFDTLRPPGPGALLYKDPTTSTWQALALAAPIGWVLTTQGPGTRADWAPAGTPVAPGVAGTCLVSNGTDVAPSYQNCVGASALSATAPLVFTPGSTGSPGVLSLSVDANFAVVSNSLAFASIASGHLLANSTAGSAAPTDTTLTALIDRAISSTPGALLTRSTSTWVGARPAAVYASPSVVCDGVTDDSAAIQAVITAAAGQEIIFPAGDCVVNTALTYSVTPSGFSSQGIQITGAGQDKTRFINRVANDYMLTVTVPVNSKVQFGAKFSNFQIINTGSPVATSSGIKLNQVFMPSFNNVTMKSLSGSGIGITNAGGDINASNWITLNHVYMDTIAGWCVTSVPGGTNVETSFIRVTNSWFQSCGTASGTTPPPSGGMQWKGLLLEISSSAFTLNNNVALYLPPSGGSIGLTVTNTGFENTISTTGPHVLISNLNMGRFTNIECLSNDTFRALGCIKFNGATDLIGRITVDGAKLRATSANNPYVAFESSGVGDQPENIRVNNVAWTDFDYTGQTRFSGVQFGQIAGSTLFSVVASNIARLASSGSGGIVPIKLAATGEWVPVQMTGLGANKDNTGLSNSTLYYAYAFSSLSAANPIAVALEFSTTVPAIDTDSGYYTKTGDTTRTYVGKTTTDGSGNLVTTAGVTQSWYAPIPITGAVVGSTTTIPIITFDDKGRIIAATSTAPGSWSVAGEITGTSASASALAVGRLGATTPALQVDASTATSITGLRVKSAASAGGVDLTAIGETNVALRLQSAGTGALLLNSTGTGNVGIGATSAVVALVVGGAGGVNAGLEVVPTTLVAVQAFNRNTGLYAGLTFDGLTLSHRFKQASGVVILSRYVSATTLTGAVTGYHLDMATNTTATDFGVVGKLVTMPAVTNVAASTKDYAAFKVTPGAIVQTTAAGTNTWQGLDITMPAITQTTGSVGSTGIKITGGVVTSGTAKAFVSDAAAGGAEFGAYISAGTKIRAAGAAPALSACGTGSPAITGSDLAGEVTMGTTASGCVITFNVAYASTPYCTVSWQATPLLSQSYVISTAAITLTQTATSGNKANYTCVARSAG